MISEMVRRFTTRSELLHLLILVTRFSDIGDSYRVHLKHHVLFSVEDLFCDSVLII